MTQTVLRSQRRAPRLVALITTFLVALSGMFVVPATAYADEANTPALSSTAAPRAGGTITVTGTGFNASNAVGVYIGLGPANLPGFYAASSQLTDTVWVAPGNPDGTGDMGRTAPLNADGTFTVTLTVPAYAENGGYALYTSKAHGQGAVDTSQNVIAAVNYEALPAVATTTTLSASANAVDAGTAIDLTATVDPAAAGTVEFFNGSVSLGTASVSAGIATLPGVVLPAGVNSLTATFAAEDTAAFLGSATAAPTLVTVTTPSTATATVTQLSDPSPAAPVTLTSEVQLSATVTEAEHADAFPPGTVEFFSIADGTTARVSLGTAQTNAEGVATLTTTKLAAGGHTFVAVFTPTDAASFTSSEGANTNNYGVVDVATAAPYAPGANAKETTGATASWDWSAYSYSGYSPWAKTTTGNASVDGNAFELTDGTVRADSGGAVISFAAELTVTAHNIPVTLTNPSLHLQADGSGVWVANVNGGTDRLPIATFTDVDPQIGEDGVRTVNFSFDGTTASGTWKAGYTGSWANAFTLQVPAALRAYYFRSGTSAANDTKQPAPLTVDFSWPKVSDTTLSVSPESYAILGDDVTLTASVAPPAAEGTVEFFDTPAGGAERSLGVVTLTEQGTAELTVNDLAAGGHSFRASFTSTNGYGSSEAVISKNYGVVDTTQPVLCSAGSDAETLTGVSATWAWSAYSAGWTKSASGNAVVNGDGAFVLSNGVARYSESCTSVSFTGTLRVEAYNGFFPENGQWVELVNPELIVDAEGNGAWVAGVRSGVAQLNTETSARTVIATVTGQDLGFENDVVNATVGLDYAGTTAAGTWAVKNGQAFENAWSNAFILLVPSAIRSFYYASGAGGDGNKSPAPIQVTWAFGSANPTAKINDQSQDVQLLQGQVVELTAGPFRAGERVDITVHSTTVNVATVVAGSDGIARATWTVPSDFDTTESHSVSFTSRDSARKATLGFTVSVNATPASGTPAEVCVARAVTSGTLSWGLKESFRTYVQGTIAKGSFSGGTFSATGGAVNVNEGGIGKINFSGSITATGHSGKLNFQLSNPSVQITGAGTAVLYATVSSTNSSGASAVNGTIAVANLSFNGPVISGDTLTVNGASATLTGAGAAAFAGFYGAGTALDPVSFSVTLGGEVACDSTTDPAVLATTGSESDLGLAAMSLAALAMLIGFGLTRMRRRSAIAA